MKKPAFTVSGCVLLFFFFNSVIFTGCKKSDNPIKYKYGTFPDTVINIADLNSIYDDYNVGIYQLGDNLPFIFSSNRGSNGGQFDLVQGKISYVFDQTTGVFGFGSSVTTDAFLTKLISKAQTTGNDFGPSRFFSKSDGLEYLVLASEISTGNLDFYYLSNSPSRGSDVPDVSASLPVKLLNTSSNDAYFTLNLEQDTAYFSSDKDGNFDIFMLPKPAEKKLSEWFDLSYTTPLKVDSLSGPADDKCPYILKKLMVFASNRPGGLGGYDLYYSILIKGKWTSPVNLGPGINTSSNEYRPVLGLNGDFTNYYLIFSSDKPGGKGGFDLYFTGLDLPENQTY